MKCRFFGLCFFLLAFSSAKSQDENVSQRSIKAESFVIQLETDRQIKFGYLAAINDSSVHIATQRVPFSNSLVPSASFKTYVYPNIETLSIRKYGSVGSGIGRGALIGSISGSLCFFVIGISSSRSFIPGPGVLALGGAIIGAIPGIIIGAIAGSKMRTFNIRKNKEKFNEMKTSVLQMSLNNK
jgi:hypothetical protein